MGALVFETNRHRRYILVTTGVVEKDALVDDVKPSILLVLLLTDALLILSQFFVLDQILMAVVTLRMIIIDESLPSLIMLCHEQKVALRP